MERIDANEAAPGEFECDAQGRLRSADEAFRALALGSASVPVGSAPWANAAPAERARAEAVLQRALDDDRAFTVEFAVAESADAMRHVRVSAVPVRDASGLRTGYLGTAIDVSDEARTRALGERLLGLLDTTADAALVFDARGTLQFANDGARSLLGVDDRAPGAEAASFVRAVLDQVPRELPGNSWDGEIGFRSPDGILRTMSVTLHVVRHADGSVQHYAVLARDVTAWRQVQDELVHQATHDALTGLPNRVLFLRRLAESIERSRTLKRGLAVLFVDLDKLKDVNDTIGHDVGDQLLAAVARRLVAAVRPADLVARIGGDEFVVLCEGVTDEHVAYDVAERVRTAMTGQVIVRGIELFTTASIGVALATTGDEIEESPADEAVTLLRNADTAMYRAKQRGRGRSELFSEKMRSDARERRALTADLERALAAGQLRLLYQPVRAAQGGRLTGAEVLLRWEHPTRGTLPPPDFLPLAIESGAIGPIGDWVVRTAFGVVRGWIDSGAVERTFALHVNLAERELADPTLVERVSAALRDAGLDASNLVVEVTESTMLADSPAVSRSLTALRRHGVRVAIDDFGTGYSSLAHLRQFPADFLKLDGTLVRDLGGDGTDDPIVRSIIQLAHSLDLTVVAEWVTSDVHLERLRVLGCDLAQGNLLGPPVAAEAFPAAARETRVPRR